jgi:hypothetical protein
MATEVRRDERTEGTIQVLAKEEAQMGRKEERKDDKNLIVAEENFFPRHVISQPYGYS